MKPIMIVLFSIVLLCGIFLRAASSTKTILKVEKVSEPVTQLEEKNMEILPRTFLL